MTLALAVSIFLFALQDLLHRIWGYVNQEYRIGKINVSLSSLVMGLLVLLFALVLSRTIQAILQRRMSRRAYIDPGIQYTIGRLAHYIIVTLGILYSVNLAFNVDLTSLAVVFTALSVGIGFGLQYLAADLASGFILLFERPIRIGDRITIGEDEGDVQSINLRTTLVTTNDRLSVIVPNSKLVSQRLVNWSYGDPRARISVPVGVAQNSDVELVRDTLLDAAKGVENVLEDPKPSVQFLKFGDSLLDFRLLVWTDRPRVHPQIRSDINFKIERLFRERGIKLSAPQREFRLNLEKSHADAENLLSHEASSDEVGRQ